MSLNRKAVIAVFTEYLMGIDPTGFNLKFYEANRFNLPDKEFQAWMTRIKEKKERLVIYAPSDSGVELDFKRNIRFAKKKGLKMFEHVFFEADGEIPGFKSPIPALVLPMIARRQAQRLTKKISIPPNMKRINPLTGQPTGESQAAKMSLPESQLLAASGLEKSLIEVLGIRGGNSSAHAMMLGAIANTGQVTLRTLSGFSSGVDATKYMSAIFTAAHIRMRGLR